MRWLQGGCRQPADPAPLLGRDARVRLDLVRDDHQEVAGRVGRQAEDAVGLFVLVGGAEFGGVVVHQVVDVEEPLGVEVLELDFGSLAEAALDRVAIDAEGVVADVDAAAGHAGAGPGAEVAEHQGAAGGHVLEGEALGVGAVDDAAAAVVEVVLGLAGEDDVGAGEADAEARVGRALDEEAAALGAIGEGLADRAVEPLALGPLALEDRDRAAQHPLADAVLGAALDADRDAVGIEGAEALAGDRAAVELEAGEHFVV